MLANTSSVALSHRTLNILGQWFPQPSLPFFAGRCYTGLAAIIKTGRAVAHSRRHSFTSGTPEAMSSGYAVQLLAKWKPASGLLH